LTYEKLRGWCHKAKRRTVAITMPKYKLEARYNLPQTLNGMGMIRAFVDPAQQTDGAQFGKLTTSLRPDDRLYITDVIHKTDIDVNEVGTEAAAATAIVFNVVSEGGPDPEPKTRPFFPIFKADKPFLFLIRESETESILFIGRYAVPIP
jgi:serine protease inhibitor